LRDREARESIVEMSPWETPVHRLFHVASLGPGFIRLWCLSFPWMRAERLPEVCHVKFSMRTIHALCSVLFLRLLIAIRDFQELKSLKFYPVCQLMEWPAIVSWILAENEQLLGQ
jgi:hypothetical protein